MHDLRPPFRLPRLMGHRGVLAYCPENSLAGLRKTAALGLGWVEFDVMLTGDGVPVLFHDDTLKRMTGIEGEMAKTRLADLAGLTVGGGYDRAFADEGIPTLETAVGVLLDCGLHPNVEIKPTPGRDVETAVATLEVLARCWPSRAPAPMISSFSRMSLAAAYALQPTWPRAFIALKAPSDWRDVLRALGCQAFHLYHKRLTRRLATEVKAAGYQLACFTVNDPKRAKRFAGWPIDCLISDAPDVIAEAFGD
ncbi:MAG: glycerophosphoryl diester phosphodiesterase [Kiloniellales bacterium]|nr:glycerophosphoryl diester phosphodiesterase [Kiloniellales bacterium]